MSAAGDDRAGTTSTSRRTALTAVLVLLGLVVALLAASAVGSWDTPRGADVTATLESETGVVVIPTPPPTLPTEEVVAEGEPGAENPFVRWLVIGVVTLIGVVVLALLLRLLASVLRRAPVEEPEAHDVTAAVADDSVDAPAILDGIARAQSALEGDRAPRDAIIEAWLALEHAATEAGVGRRPAQTPTEFTAVVLERTPADRDAVDLLRGLYLRVRFSDDHLQRGDAAAARDALTTISVSWSELDVPS